MHTHTVTVQAHTNAHSARSIIESHKRTHDARSSLTSDISASRTVIVRNRLVLLTQHSTSAHKRYELTFNASAYTVNALIAHSVYDACKRHVMRIELHTSSMRNSMYVLRSDIRALVREIQALEYAH